MSSSNDHGCFFFFWFNVQQIKGDALVLYTMPGHDFKKSQWEELDNVIYDELMEFFGQGLKPRAEDLRKLVDDFKNGRFRYQAEATAWTPGKGEDVNKDDGHEENDDLPGWG